MADVRRLRILKALSTTLQDKIRTADGYALDLTPTEAIPKHVYRGRVIFGEDDEVPMISILEVPVPIDPIESASTKTFSAGPWELIIQGFVDDDPENPTDPAHPFLADVKRCLALEKERDRGDDIFGLGDQIVTDLHIGAGVVRPPDDTSSKAYFWLSVRLDIVENLTNPTA